jgi:hypothetical protein
MKVLLKGHTTLNIIFMKTKNQGMQNISNAIFLIQEGPGFNWSLEEIFPTISGYIYKMLVACASDNWGRNIITS